MKTEDERAVFDGSPTHAGLDDALELAAVGGEIDLRGEQPVVHPPVDREAAAAIRSLSRRKRVFDLVVGSILLIAALPLLGLIAAIVVCTSRGPAFYRSERWGHGGGSFRAIKFRSMRTDADAILVDLLAQDSTVSAEYSGSFKLKDDPRITRVGRFLRRHSLDELPQLINVVRGEMSIVGPRPKLIDERERYGPLMDTVLSVRPGLTGLWQVSGRNDVDYDERIQLDVEYVEHHSTWTDLVICGRTAVQLVRSSGSY